VEIKPFTSNERLSNENTWEAIRSVERQLYHTSGLRFRFTVHEPRETSLAVRVPFSEIFFEVLPCEKRFLVVELFFVSSVLVARGIHKSDKCRRYIGIRRFRIVEIGNNRP
jgi:hypothetical protein